MEENTGIWFRSRRIHPIELEQLFSSNLEDDYEPCGSDVVEPMPDYNDDDIVYIDALNEKEYDRDRRFYGPGDEQKIGICSLAGNFSWKEPSSGTSWIGVYGIGGTCAVSMDQDALKLPSCHWDSTKILHITVADMKDGSSAICQRMLDHCFRTGSETGPFAVVSIAPDALPVPVEYNIEGAISFLTKELKGRKFLSVEETEQIAICAMKYLFGSMCNSSEMKIWCSGKHKHEWTLRPCQIEDHLNAINWTITSKDLPASFSSLCLSSSGS